MVDSHLFAMEAVEPQISFDQWDWIRGLIRDVERDESREEFPKRLFQWDLAVKQFRKAEQAKMVLSSPSERDIRCHSICTCTLIAIGQSLVLQAEQAPADELQSCKMNHEQLAAYVEDLEQSFREWHHGFTPEEVKATQEAIFGAQT
jgi:hypothetical protein